MKSDELIVIIGSGKYAEAILERAILVNIIAPEQSMAYHLFGDYGNFLSNHYCLSSVFSINGEDNSGKDRLFVHSGSWNAEPLLLAEADRIILCDSDCSANLDIFQQLKSFHCPRCRVDLLSPFTVEEAYTFGEYNELFTSDLVLREKLNRTARLMNDIYVKSSDGKAPSWEGLSEFKRQSNIAAADHLPVKVRLLLNDCEILGPSAADIKNAAAAYAENRDELSDMCRRIEHERWNRFHFMYNWSFSESRNDRERKHNDLKSFDELSPSEQAKDDFAWELIGLLSDN